MLVPFRTIVHQPLHIVPPTPPTTYISPPPLPINPPPHIHFTPSLPITPAPPHSLHPSTECGPYNAYDTTYALISEPVTRWKQDRHASKVTTFIVDVVASTAFIVAVFVLLWLVATVVYLVGGITIKVLLCALLISLSLTIFGYVYILLHTHMHLHCTSVVIGCGHIFLFYLDRYCYISLI